MVNCDRNQRNRDQIIFSMPFNENMKSKGHLKKIPAEEQVANSQFFLDFKMKVIARRYIC